MTEYHDNLPVALLLGYGTIGEPSAEMLMDEGFPSVDVVRSDGVIRSTKREDGSVVLGHEFLHPQSKSDEDRLSLLEVYMDDVDPDILVNTLPPIGDGEFAYAVMSAALKRGIDVAMAEKAALANYYAELVALAAANGAYLGFDATVAGGADVFSGIRANRSEISEGFLMANGTTLAFATLMHDIHKMLAFNETQDPERYAAFEQETRPTGRSFMQIADQTAISLNQLGLTEPPLPGRSINALDVLNIEMGMDYPRKVPTWLKGAGLLDPGVELAPAHFMVEELSEDDLRRLAGRGRDDELIPAVHFQRLDLRDPADFVEPVKEGGEIHTVEIEDLQVTIGWMKRKSHPLLREISFTPGSPGAGYVIGLGNPRPDGSYEIQTMVEKALGAGQGPTLQALKRDVRNAKSA